LRNNCNRRSGEVSQVADSANAGLVKVDYIVLGLKGAAGTIPVVGGRLAEIVGTIILN